MIRSKRLTLALLDAWLVLDAPSAAAGKYRLRLWRDDKSHFSAAAPEVVAYVHEAFEDARRVLRRGFEDMLSPFADPLADPAANYPALLHSVTLQGYWGEILAVISVEHWGAHGQTDWQIPAMLFRTHHQEFQHLETINERLRSGRPHSPDDASEKRPGRTGDDAIAFRRSKGNVITDVLTVEAKCLQAHQVAKIHDAHAKLSKGPPLPSAVRELINILSDYDTHEAELWVEALLQLWQKGYRTAVRTDGVAYACGQAPAKKPTWMSASAPDTNYTAKRNLEAMEFHFTDLPAVIEGIFKTP